MLEEILSDAVTHFEWDLLILILVIITGPIILERFRVPGLLGLVLGGMIVGPYVLGLLEGGDLDALAAVGLLYMMFLAGAELDLNLFQRIRNAAVTFGLLAFSIPLILGMVVGLLLKLSIPAAILMGSVWASHTLVAFSIVRKAGLANNKAVATVVGATLITDTLALIVLSVVSGSVSQAQGSSGAQSLLPIMRLGLGLVVLAIYCLVLLPRLGHWFFAGPGQERIQRFLFVLAALASAGLLAKLGGIEGLVGAFFAGVGLNRLLPNEGQLMKEVEFFGMALFIPAFLVSVGMLINPAVLFSVQTLLLAGAFITALVLGKLFASLLAGRIFQYSKPEVGVMFSLTITQAAATLATVMVGLKIGLLGEEIVNSVLLVVIVSLVATSIGTRYYVRKITPEKIAVTPIGASVILPVFPSKTLPELISLAAKLVQQDVGIINPVVVVREHEIEHKRPEAEECLKTAEEIAAATSADVVGKLRIDSSIHCGVVRELEERDGSMILMEWQRDPTPHQLLFGNEIDRIGATSPVPVAIVRLSDEKISRVVLAMGDDDGSTGYRLDMQVCVGLAERLAISEHQTLALLSPGQDTPVLDINNKKFQLVNVEHGIEGFLPHLQSGDLVILPGAVVAKAVGTHASKVLSTIEKISVMVAAGPHRLSLTAAEVGKDTAAIMKLGTAI